MMNIDDLIILYEDNHLLVVLKEVGIPTCPDEKNTNNNMLFICKQYIKNKYDKKGNVYLGQIHRLDVQVGGCLVFCKTSKAASRLSQQITNNEFIRKYFAVTNGIPSKKSDVLINYIKKDTTINKSYICNQYVDGAKLAKLQYSICQIKDNLCLLDVEIFTGRSHQIRVQLSNINVPILNDVKYNNNKLIDNCEFGLWCYYISFTHPVTKKTMTFKIEPPKELYPWSIFEYNIKNNL